MTNLKPNNSKNPTILQRHRIPIKRSKMFHDCEHFATSMSFRSPFITHVTTLLTQLQYTTLTSTTILIALKLDTDRCTILPTEKIHIIKLNSFLLTNQLNFSNLSDEQKLPLIFGSYLVWGIINTSTQRKARTLFTSSQSSALGLLKSLSRRVCCR